MQDGIIDAQGKLKCPDPVRLTHAKQAMSQRKKSRVLGRETLQEVWSDMMKTTLPSWCCPAPTQIGDGEHGKISADGWRTFGSVHLVITLGRLWGQAPPESRRYKLLTNFYGLVHATKIATMRSTTVVRAQEFQDHMIAYLRGLDELFPTNQLVPSHHIVLHMKELLCRFGPTHAWRCWVFERYNHTLQKIPTNGKFGMNNASLSRTCHGAEIISLGQLEMTLFERFCMNQRLRGIINAFGLDSTLEKLVTAFTQHFGPNEVGTLKSDMQALKSSPLGQTVDENPPKGKKKKLDQLISKMLQAYEERKGPVQSRQAVRLGVKHDKFTRYGASFSPFNCIQQDSYVAVGENVSEGWHAGRIHSIFTYTHEGPTPELVGHTETYFVVQKYEELTEMDAMLDPYRKHPSISGRLYYDRVKKDPELVTPGEILCHFAHTPFEHPHIVSPCIHALPLDRVRWFSLSLQTWVLTHNNHG